MAGLGNPGERYATTRHNAGAMVVERLAERLDARLRKVRFGSVLAAEARTGDVPLLLVVPTSFMNENGPPVASFARRREVPVERVVACHDDIDLAFGSLRLKRGGGTAGHHGLDSMVGAFRSKDFYRVRLGIGRPAGRWENVGFLLEPFARRERDDVDLLVELAADAVRSLVTEGLTAAQSRYNRSVAAER